MVANYINYLYGDTDSALIGSVPNNQDDWNFLNGLYRSFGLDLDPTLGFPLAPMAPVGYVHESKQAGIVGAMGVLIAAIIVPTGARILLKRRSANAILGYDDYTIVIASVIAIAYPIIVIIMCTTAGAGRHTWENTYADYQRFYYYLSVCNLLFYMAVGMTKVSITLFVRRLALDASRLWQIVADVFLVTVILLMLGTLFWSVFACRPSRATWDMWYAGSLTDAATCGDLVTATRVIAIIHTVQNLLLLFTPIVILWHVKINLAKKIRLFVIWASGGATVTFGLLQLFASNSSTDIFWIFTDALRWTSFDIVMGVLTASLPVLDSAIMGVWHAVTSSGDRTRYGESHGGAHQYDWPDSRTATPIIVNRGIKLEDSESVENILQHENGIMLRNIVRTDKFHTGNEAYRDESSSSHM
ncbi:hypothetical protein BX600DRAFT_430406 [Xylariales sp. PMI_506]|nr:hypothetical protein BX600DRAFT_430406 [Xylariales sp. PMI_506]